MSLVLLLRLGDQDSHTPRALGLGELSSRMDPFAVIRRSSPAISCSSEIASMRATLAFASARSWALLAEEVCVVMLDKLNIPRAITIKRDMIEIVDIRAKPCCGLLLVVIGAFCFIVFNSVWCSH